MKTTALFTNCIVTATGPFFCGETKEGVLVYATETDVQRGFKMFTQYKVFVDEYAQRDIPLIGMHVSASIIRMPYLQIPEWLRLSQLVQLLRSTQEGGAHAAILKLESIVDEKRVASTTATFPSTMPF